MHGLYGHALYQAVSQSSSALHLTCILSTPNLCYQNVTWWGQKAVHNTIRIKVSISECVLHSPTMPNGSTLLLEKDFSYFVVIVNHFQVDVAAAQNICH